MTNEFHDLSLKNKIINLWHTKKAVIIIVFILVVLLLIGLLLIMSKQSNNKNESSKHTAIESIMIYNAQNYIKNNNLNLSNKIYIPLNKLNITINNSLECNSTSGVFFDNKQYYPYLICNNYNSNNIKKILENNQSHKAYATLRGDNPYIVSDSEYKEPGYSIEEGYDINTKEIVIDNGINIVDYHILKDNKYVATLQRIVIAENIKGSAPELELVGNKVRTISLNTPYIESGYSAFDKIDGDIKSKVITNGSVDTSKSGTYAITYSVTNSRGLTSKAIRTIIVNNNEVNLNIKHSLSPSTNTFDTVTISIIVSGDGYDYTTLPNKEKVTNNQIKYVVHKNGIYEFIVYDRNSNSESYEVKITNIKDKNPEITSVTSKNLLVTVTAKKGANPINGYYFSTSPAAPNGTESNWVNTPDNYFNVIKIPGTYYVYVKDIKDIISPAKTITIDNTIIYPFKASIINRSLNSVLAEKGYSTIELNKLLARSVRSAGLYTREGIVTAALGLVINLGKDYGIRVPYYWGGKYKSFGANPEWGAKTNNIKVSRGGNKYDHLGLDCSGFVVWAFRNAGFNMKVIGSGYFASNNATTETGGFGSDRFIGDVIVSDGHIAMIVGKYNAGYIVAENANNIYLHPYTRKNGYRIQNIDITLNNTSMYFPDTQYPSGY